MSRPVPQKKEPSSSQSSTTTDRELPPLNPRKTTPSMRASFQNLQRSLQCPLCHNILIEPSTLSCSHTFCFPCIDTYSCNSWTCPVSGCHIPIAVRGSRNGSFIKINPSIQSVLHSLTVIEQALHRAPDEWWKMSMPPLQETAIASASAATNTTASTAKAPETPTIARHDSIPQLSLPRVTRRDNNQRRNNNNNKNNRKRSAPDAAADDAVSKQFSIDSHFSNPYDDDDDDDVTVPCIHIRNRLTSLSLPNTSPNCSPIAKRPSRS